MPGRGRRKVRSEKTLRVRSAKYLSDGSPGKSHRNLPVIMQGTHAPVSFSCPAGPGTVSPSAEGGGPGPGLKANSVRSAFLSIGLIRYASGPRVSSRMFENALLLSFNP